MNLRTKSLLAAAAGVLALGAAGTTVFAATDTNTATTLAERISTTFNLEPSKVQEVIDEYRTEKRTERQADRKADLSERLATAVSNGTITSDQRDAILAKHAEMETKIDAAMALTDETARREALDSARDEIKTWMEDNNIPTSVGRMLRGPGGKGGPGGMNRESTSTN